MPVVGWMAEMQAGCIDGCGIWAMNIPENSPPGLGAAQVDATKTPLEPNAATAFGPGKVSRLPWWWLAWIPLAVALLVMLLDRPGSWGSAYEWPFLVLTCNFIFSTLASVFIAYLAGKSFLVRGAPGVLLLGCGVVAWGAAGVVANLSSRGDANQDVTIHNCGVWVSAWFHLMGAMLLRRPIDKVRMPGPWLAAGYIGALGAVGLGAIWAVDGHAPAFFVPGRGGTPVRQLVLASAIAMFALAALVMFTSRKDAESAFRRWYIGALAAIGIGLMGILVQSTLGGLRAWAGRGAMWLGGVYMVMAGLAAARESRVWGIGLEEALWRSERQLAADLDAMTRLHKLGTSFVRDENLQDLLGEIVDVAIAIAVADFGTIQLLDKSSGNLRIAAQQGFAQWWVDHWQEIHSGKGTCGAAMEGRERIIVEDVEKSPMFAGTPSLEVQLKAGVRACQSTPLIGRSGKLLGMFSTHWKHPHKPAERELRLLDLLARQAADLIERMQAEQALRESERRLTLALEGGHMGSWELNLRTEQPVWNATEYELLGLPVGDGQPPKGAFIKHVHPDDAARLDRSLQQAVENRTKWRDEFRVIRADGQVRWLVGAAQVILDSDGNPERMVGVNYDITERREFEAELERIVVSRTAKLRELVGELEHFSYTLTHDLRAPLRSMRGFAALLQEMSGPEPGEEQQLLMRRIIDSASRMDLLIVDALSYTKVVRQELPLGPVDLWSLLRGMIESYPEYQPYIDRIQIEGTIPPVLGNTAGLTQCFSNILGNAVKFVKPGQIPEIRMWAEVRGSEAGTTQSACASASRVRIWIEDKGIGISPVMIPRVFNVFARGTADYEGTGIGLALVRKVVDRMGGQVGVESALGQGSRFWVELLQADDRQPIPVVIVYLGRDFCRFGRTF